MSLLSSIPFVATSLWLAADKEDFDTDSVTPGVIGFVATFLIMVVVVLLAIDLVRRVRRTQYRSEINELLDAEEAKKSGDGPVSG